jgi:peptidoglycan/LPS O-acetylase OafA/YrhL
MSKDDDWNWPLAGFVLALILGALIALAIPSLRMVGVLILLGYGAAIHAGVTYSWYGAKRPDVWVLLVTGFGLIVMGAVLDLPASERTLVIFFGAVNIVHAGWRHRRLKATRATDP